MGEPVAEDGHGLHLDGILAWAVYRAMSQEDKWLLPPINTAWAEDFDLPLKRFAVEADVPETADERLTDKQGRVWSWVATRAERGTEKHGVVEIRKRVPHNQLVRYTNAVSVNPSLGPSKAYDLKQPTVWAPELRWYAIGDRDACEHLLRSQLYGVGKYCSKGMGRVMEWRVCDAAVSEDYILEQRSVPTRQGEATAIGGVRPPYHHVSRRTYIREPQQW
jgi:CRISPR type IV-associated protein Csf3